MARQPGVNQKVQNFNINYRSFFLQWRVNHAKDQDCKAATQYINAGARGGASMMH